MGRFLLLVALACARLAAQTPCANTPTYSSCDLVFELNDTEAAAHPHPYLTADIHAEFRSPRFKTFLMPAFWDGGRRMVIRFSPTEPGEWIYRVSSNVTRFEGQQGTFTAQASGAAGFVLPANLHHFVYTEINSIGGSIPHLWMGDTILHFAALDDAAFRAIVDARAAQKFNHIRGLAIEPDKSYKTADEPDPAYFQGLDGKMKYMNNKGFTVDLILAGASNQMLKLFPDWRQRERYIRYIVARYAPMNVTWQGIEEFETYDNGRQLLKEVGGLLKKLDPYGHPRSTDTQATSSPVQDDGWQNYISYRSADDQLGAVEHQLQPTPFVNFQFARQNADADAFRHRLWNAAMNGQYLGLDDSGKPDANAPAAKQMAALFDLFLHTRHWELEPYFDVDGGRALAVEGIEYIVYIEKPGPIEVLVEKHGYDISWLNPVTGEVTKQKKEFKGERFTGEPPDTSHDWVLQISRESKKESMLRSVKFDSREVPLALQEIETNPAKVPFEIAGPVGPSLPVAVAHPFSVKLKRESRATRSMMYMWEGEVAASGQGFRVLATGAKGTLHIPPEIARTAPADMTVRVFGMNANGKVYSVNTAFGLTK